MTGETPGEAELRRVDARGRIGNTAVQVGIPAAIVGLGSWICALLHIDLDPGAGTDMPAQVAGYFVAVIGSGIAWLMNRRNLRP